LTHATDSEPLTRSEIAQAIGAAFGMGQVDRDQIVETARRCGARPEVVSMLEQLPARRFNDLRELWSELPEMPVR